jgi:Protein of unknown function (DUF2777)
MSPYKRTDLLFKQKRSYLIGLIEMTDDQFVIFDDMNDEVHLLEEIQDHHIEILRPHGWEAGKLLGVGKVKTQIGMFSLNCGDTVRIKKRLPQALDEMLKELSDETFIRFINQLNTLSFSPFDCVYSYNQLLFLETQVYKKGVSFYQFDNEDSICAIQHHFDRGVYSSDRIEITTSLGERSLICSMY